MDELEKLVSGGEDTTSSGESKTNTPDEQAKSDEITKEAETLENLRRAKAEALEELKTIRKQAKEAKASTPEEEVLPKIDFESPDARAWDRHIRGSVDPLSVQLEKEKEEVVGLALNEFLSDKPELAANAEKRKEFIDTYQALATARGITERNKDVVTSVLESAYGSIAYKETLDQQRRLAVSRAKAEAAYNEVATDSGSTTYRNDAPVRRRQLTKDETEAAIRMYGGVDAYWKALDAVNS